MIENFKVHIWLAWLFPIAFAGALFPIFDSKMIAISTMAMSILNFYALKRSWENRNKIEKLKKASDYTAVFGMSLFVVMLFSGNLLVALVWFIAFSQIALNLTFKGGRHYYLGLLITFVLLLVGAAESKTGFYLFYIIAYCVFVSVSLGYYFMDRRLQKNKGTYQDMNWSMSHRIKVISSLIFLSFLIYLIIPRFDAANFGGKYGLSEKYYSDESWERQADSKQGNQSNNKDKNKVADGEMNSEEEPKNSSNQNGENQETEFDYSGFSDSFDIRSEKKEGGIPPNVIVAYMQAEHGAYLKIETFDKFDGISWHKTQDVDIKKKLSYGRIALNNNFRANYNQNITIKENLGAYIPAAAIPVELIFPSTVIGVDAYGMLKLPSGLSRNTHYSVDSHLQFINNRMFSGDSYRPTKQDLVLPSSFDERVRDLSQRIAREAFTDLDKAGLLEKHLRENYEYSYSSIFNSQNKTPVAKFLLEDKKGHCEYFASSLAIMLRSIGIPARLVTGFSATAENPLSGYYEMRVLDGHAWVEAWVDELGWAVFEPTPFYSPPIPNEEISSFEKIQNYVEQLRKIQEEAGLEDQVSIENILSSLWESISLLFVIVFGAIKLFLMTAWKFLIALAVMLGVVYLLWDKWRPLVLKRVIYSKVLTYNPTNKKQAVRFYLTNIQALMRLKGVNRHLGTTIEQYVDLIKNHADQDIMKEVVFLVNQSYYDDAAVLNIEPILLKDIFMELYRNT